MNSTHIGTSGFVGDVISNPNTPIPGVKGWTYGAAVRELISSRQPVDLVLFPFAAAWLGLREEVEFNTEPPAAHGETTNLGYTAEERAFIKRTGWTPEDALSMALECREEKILNGRRGRGRGRRLH